tara:strand:- start:386 stop:1114 length:729 start_codon:yes stop_codon:yes gene_type:complete
MADVQEKIQEETLEGSETSENNSLSEPAIEQDLSSDADEVRKFQSMYDKAQAELGKLRPVAKLFQDNPELVDVVRNHLTGDKGQDKEQISMKQEDFNPWEAFTNPASESYKMRQKEIDDAVSDKMKGYMNRLERQRQIDSLKFQVQGDYKLNNNEAEEFVNFVTQPKESLPLDTLFQVWKGNSAGNMKAKDNVESVRQTQQMPKSAGIVQGGQPAQPKPEDDYFNRILAAGNTNQLGSNIKK